MSARDLRVQIAGDASQLMRAVAQADGSLGKLNESVKRSAMLQEEAWAKAGRGPRLAASAAMANAEAQELASRRVKASLTEMVSMHAAGLQKMGDATVSAGQKLKSFGGSLTSFTLPLIGLGAAATKFAVDFNRNMEMLHTQAGYTQKQVDSLSKGVEKLAPKVGASPAELAEGLYHVASAGLDASRALEVVKEAAIGAKMGGASLDETTYALTSLLKSAPKDIHNAADAMGMMNAIVGQGDMRMQDLVGSLSTGVMPAAQAAGLGFRDVGAALDVMTARGIPAELSGTRLRMTFALMEKQSKKAGEALESIGITQNQLGEDLRKPRGLLVAVEDLKHHLEASGKSATDQNKILLEVFGGGRSSAAIQTLIQNVGDLGKQYEKLPAAADAVSQLNDKWKAFNQTPAQQVAKDIQEANVALIGLGQDVLPVALPALKDTAKIIGDVAHTFEGLPGPVKEFGLYAVAGAAGFGLLMKPVGGLITAVGTFERLLGTAGIALGGFGAKTEAMLTAQVAVAEREGAMAGTAYGTAFSAAAGETMTAGGLILPAGVKSIPGIGAATAEAEAGTLGMGAMLRRAPGFLMKGALRGGLIAFGGMAASEVAGAAIGGHAGHDVSAIGKDVAIGAGLGSFLGPEGTLAGGVLGGLIGGFKAFDKRAESEGKKLAKTVAKGMGKPVQKAVESGLDKANSDYEKAIYPHGKPEGINAVNPHPEVSAQREREARERRELERYATGEQVGSQIVTQQLNVTQGMGGYAQVASIINYSKKRLAELPEAARGGARHMILDMVAELEHDKRLPQGSVTELVRELGKAFNGLEGPARRAASGAMRTMAFELKGQHALDSAVSFVNQLRNVWPEIPKSANINASNATKFFQDNMAILDRLMYTGPEFQRKAAAEKYKRLRDEAIKYFGDLRHGAEGEVKKLNKKIGPLSAEGTTQLVNAYVRMREGVEGQMALSVEAVRGGLHQINRITAEEMKALGLGNMGHNLNRAFGPSPGNSTLLQTSTIEGVGSGNTTVEPEPKFPYGLGKKADGGMIGAHGERGHDNVPVLLGRGEAVLNHYQQRPVEIGLAYSKALGIQPYGSLGELFSAERRPHYMASGGVVAPKVGVDGAFGAIAQGALNLDATLANTLIGKLAAQAAPVSGFPSNPSAFYTPSELRIFDGHPVARWIVPELAWARQHGWKGQVTSGWRSPNQSVHGVFATAPQGRSEHRFDIYPHGAVDVSDYEQFAAIIRGYPGAQKLLQLGIDPLHFSGTGHAAGGFAGFGPMHAALMASGGFAGGQFLATAYGPPWEGIEGSGVTATGMDLKKAPHRYIIAVDPKIIPLGTEAKIWPNPFGYMGNFLAADTGGAIKGHRIDFYDWQGRAAQNAWGARKVTISAGKSVTASRRKAEPGLMLTHGQESHVGHLVHGVEAAHGDIGRYQDIATQAQGEGEGINARLNATPVDLKTEKHPDQAKGIAGPAMQRAEFKTANDEAVLKLYRDELRALQREVKGWEKLRNYFKHLARGLHGKAKKQALDAAGKYQKNIDTAKKDARELHGTIYSQETKVIEDQNAEKALPGEIDKAKEEAVAEGLANDYGAYQKQADRITLEEEAGRITKQQGDARRQQLADEALHGKFGALSEEDQLRIEADKRKATEDNTRAQEENTRALMELTKTQNEQLQAAKTIAEVETGVAVKALADIINGQIGGINYHGRAMTAGAPGMAARY